MRLSTLYFTAVPLVYCLAYALTVLLIGNMHFGITSTPFVAWYR